MTKSLDFNQFAKELSYEILKTTSPTNDKVNLRKKVSSFEVEKGLTLDDQGIETLLKKTKQNLQKHLAYRVKKNSIAKFEFSKTDDDFLIGIAAKDAKYNVFPRFYHHLIKMNDYLFEKFSGKYIELLFCDFSFVSRKSSDGGIDFLGKGNFNKVLNIKGLPVNLKSKDIAFKIIGQSKRYKPENAIGPKEIREFLGSVKILQESTNPSKVSAWQGQMNVLEKVKLADPFLYIFITTSYYTKDAVDLANKLGIYIFDIDDLIFDLIDNNIALTGTTVDLAKLDEWIKR